MPRASVTRAAGFGGASAAGLLVVSSRNKRQGMSRIPLSARQVAAVRSAVSPTNVKTDSQAIAPVSRYTTTQIVAGHHAIASRDAVAKHRSETERIPLAFRTQPT